MKKKNVLIVLALALVVLATPFVSIVQAKQIVETDMGYYTEYIGTLGKAGFAFLMPKAWNGKLVVACHFFMPEALWSNNPKAGVHMAYYMMGAMNFASRGYAFAYSTYDEPGYCIQNGMIRTHQLTEWLIDNFDISDEIYLFGYSMGFISVLLAEKYPDLYDGVLDVVGPKDLKTRYNSWIGLPDPMGILPALEAECGGTPDEKPKAYEKRSPTYNADLKVPVISLYGTEDTNVPPIHAEMFYDAVEAAGSLDYYRGYVYSGYGHGSFAQHPVVALHFRDLVDWVENGIEPPTDPYPLPP